MNLVLFSRCTTAEYNDLIIENIGQLHWGFKFRVPKFSGYNELYVLCNVYLCHATQQAKPYCDRSCTTRSARVQRRVSKRDTGKSEEKRDDDGMVGSVKEGPFVFYEDRSKFPFANPEDQYVSVDESGICLRVLFNQGYFYATQHPNSRSTPPKFPNLSMCPKYPPILPTPLNSQP